MVEEINESVAICDDTRGKGGARFFLILNHFCTFY